MEKQDPKTFIKRMLTNRFKKCISTLAKKKTEYTVTEGEDRFHNFVEGAKLMDSLPYSVTPMDCLRFYQSKHLCSVIDHIKGKEITQKLLDEKIGDLFNYNILALGMLMGEHDLGIIIAEQSALINTNLSVKQIMTNFKEENPINNLLVSMVGNWKQCLQLPSENWEEQYAYTQYMIFDTLMAEYYLREELWESQNQNKSTN